MRQERQHVVLGLALDRLYALEIVGPLALGPDRRGGALGNDARLRQRLGGMGLDLEPDGEPVLRRPDGAHPAPAVAWDHERRSLGKKPRRGLAQWARRRNANAPAPRSRAATG